MNGGGGDRQRGVCLAVSRSRGGRGAHRALARRNHSYHNNHNLFQQPAPRSYLPPSPSMWPHPRQFHHPHHYRPPHYGPHPPPDAGYMMEHPGHWGPSYDSWSPPFPRGRRNVRFISYNKSHHNISLSKRFEGTNIDTNQNYSKYDMNVEGTFRDIEEDEYNLSICEMNNYEDCSNDLSQLNLECQVTSSDMTEQIHTPVYRVGLNRTEASSAKTNSSCDSVSITSDEGTPDTMLPRIIKPRKRRKKDRKPSNSSTTSEDCKKENVSVSPKNDSSDGMTFVTLKPYVPFYSKCDYGSDSEKSVKEESNSNDSTSVEQEDSNCGVHHQTMKSKCCLDNDRRVCGCEKCVPSHSFPTPPSSPSSASSYSSKKSTCCRSSSSSGDCDNSSSLGLSSSGSDDEYWPSNSDRPLVRSYSEPTEACKLSRKTVIPATDALVSYKNNEVSITDSVDSVHSSSFNENCDSVVSYVPSPRNTIAFRTLSGAPPWSTFGYNSNSRYTNNCINTLKRRHSLNSSRSSSFYFRNIRQYAGTSYIILMLFYNSNMCRYIYIYVYIFSYVYFVGTENNYCCKKFQLRVFCLHINILLLRGC